MATAAIYCRISDDREGAGLGVERQEKDCRTLADSLGWDVGRVYVDNDLSAFNRRKPRPQYRQLLADLQSGDVKALVVWHNDRLHRSSRELEDFIDVVEKTGAAVQTVKAGRYDLTTPSGRLNARLVGAVAQYESEHKAERNRAKALQLAEAGKVGNGGPRPFGYLSDRVSIHEAEAATLRRVYADVLAGRSLRSIVRDLHEQGITSSTGRPWTVQALKLTLLRGRNIGWREHHGRLVAPAVWPAIIDRDTWEQARAVLTDPKRNVGPGNARRHLLTGFLFCGLCGHPLRPVRSSDNQRFGCRKEAGSARCGSILVRYEPAEAFVEAVILAKLERDADLQPDLPDDPTEEIKVLIGVEEAKLVRLAEVFADVNGDALELRAAGQRVRERIAGLREQIKHAAVERRIADPVEIRKAWPDLDLQQRREIIGVLVERIDVGPARRGVNRFEANRLSFVWR